jgi:hypothetical protein
LPRTWIVVPLRTREAFAARADAMFRIEPRAMWFARAVRWNVFSRLSRRSVQQARPAADLGAARADDPQALGQRIAVPDATGGRQADVADP